MKNPNDSNTINATFKTGKGTDLHSIEWVKDILAENMEWEKVGIAKDESGQTCIAFTSILGDFLLYPSGYVYRDLGTCGHEIRGELAHEYDDFSFEDELDCRIEWLRDIDGDWWVVAI